MSAMSRFCPLNWNAEVRAARADRNLRQAIQQFLGDAVGEVFLVVLLARDERQHGNRFSLVTACASARHLVSAAGIRCLPRRRGTFLQSSNQRRQQRR
jgi:hypothetical protein